MKFVHNIALLIISLVITCCVLELYIRSCHPGPLVSPRGIPYFVRGDQIDFGGIPNRIIKEKNCWFDVEYSMNNKGFRGQDFIYDKKDGVKRILVFGDSFTYGMGCADNEYYCYKLQESLNSKYGQGKWEVLNFGVGAVGTAMELALYKNEGIRYDPDIVIIQFFSNDPGDSAYFNMFDDKRETHEDSSFNGHELFQQIRNYLALNRIYVYLCEHSHLVNLLRRRIVCAITRMEGIKLAGEGISNVESYSETMAIQNFREFIDLVCGENKELIVFTYNDCFDGFPTLYAYLSKQKSEKFHLMKVDIPDEGIIKGDLHWNPKGHKMVSNGLYSYLSEKGLLDGGIDQ